MIYIYIYVYDFTFTEKKHAHLCNEPAYSYCGIQDATSHKLDKYVGFPQVAVAPRTGTITPK